MVAISNKELRSLKLFNQWIASLGWKYWISNIGALCASVISIISELDLLHFSFFQNFDNSSKIVQKEGLLLYKFLKGKTTECFVS